MSAVRPKVFAIPRPPLPAAVLRGEAPNLRLEPGDPAPAFQLSDDRGRLTSPWEVRFSGNPIVLVFCGERSGQRWLDELHAYRDAQSALTAHRAVVFAITDQPVEVNRALESEHRLGFAILSDRRGAIARAYGVALQAGAAVTMLLDNNHRVAEIVADGDRALQAQQVLRFLGGQTPPRSLALGAHPPVLVVPRALGREESRKLIEFWHRPVPLWEPDPVTQECAAYQVEKGDFKLKENLYGRVVQMVVRDPELQAYVDDRLMRRLIPEIENAFQTTITQREAYRIACYDAADFGGLPQHRDNNSEATAFRRFTVSVVLNAGEFVGGQLRFREFSEQVYEVDSGTAVVWSASLLHEVLPVTQGRRFMIATHMSGG